MLPLKNKIEGKTKQENSEEVNSWEITESERAKQKKENIYIISIAKFPAISQSCCSWSFKNLPKLRLKARLHS